MVSVAIKTKSSGSVNSRTSLDREQSIVVAILLGHYVVRIVCHHPWQTMPFCDLEQSLVELTVEVCPMML
jgi:hypothetical protein